MKKIRNNCHTICVVSVLAFFSVLGKKITFVNMDYRNDINTFSDFTITDVGSYFLAVILLGIEIYLLRWIIEKKIDSSEKKEKKKSSLKKTALVTGIILLMWLPWFLHLYPGTLPPDALNSVGQIVDNQLNNHHPVAFTLFVGIFIKSGMAMGNINIGVALFSAVQSIILAGTLAMTIRYMWERNVHRAILITALLIYGIVPLFPVYAVIMQKDTLFSCSLVWLTLWLSEHADEKMDFKRRAQLFILALLSCLLRNNGVYIILLIAFISLFLYKTERKQYCITLGLAVIGFFVVVKFVYPAMGVEQTEDKREQYGVLLQQTAYVICNDGEIGQEDADVLFQILPKEDWKEAYRPCLVDNLKWYGSFDNAYFSENSDLFVKTWFRLFLKNPVDYVKAYCLNTFGFWALGIQDSANAYTDTGVWENQYGITAKDYTKNMLNGTVSEFLDRFDIVIGSGTLAWITLILLAAALQKRLKKLFIVALPALANWITILLATPLAFSMRYVYIFVLMTPLIVIMTFTPMIKEDSECSSILAEKNLLL